jgi:hypothetical protein
MSDATKRAVLMGRLECLSDMLNAFSANETDDWPMLASLVSALETTVQQLAKLPEPVEQLPLPFRVGPMGD